MTEGRAGRSTRTSGGPSQARTGEEIELSIGPIAHGGHCVARTGDGQVVFVRHSLPGERVLARITEVRGGYLRADAIEIRQASPLRVSAACAWARPGGCGGCDLQHVSPAGQRTLKGEVIAEQLRRLGGLSEAEVAQLEVAVVAPRAIGAAGTGDEADTDRGLGWRTRVEYAVGDQGRAGLRAHRSHEVIPITECLIAHEAIRATDVLDLRWSRGASVTTIAAGDGRVTIMTCGAPGRRTRRVSGPDPVQERALGRAWPVPASAFWQVHPAAAETLANAVTTLLRPRAGERCLDLYGGVGLFAAALAQAIDASAIDASAKGASAKGDSANGGRGATGRTGRSASTSIAPVEITLVEGHPATTAAARVALADLPAISVVTADVADFLARRDPAPVDLVVLDPPRAGAGAAVVRRIHQAMPRAVAYVACDPAALARDVRTFRELGWRLAKLAAFDLFPMTHHVECVALLEPPAESRQGAGPPDYTGPS